jgi:hypothetical protein
MMAHLIPDGFLTLKQAANKLAVALFAGVPDRSVIEQHKKSGFDVADGAAVEQAISEIWAALDRGKLGAFVVGPRHPSPLRISARMSEGIPLLRSLRGGDFSFLRPRNPYYGQFIERFGRDLTSVLVVLRASEVTSMARSLLGARRRRTPSVRTRNAGRPSRRGEVKREIRAVIDKRQWSPLQSLKALTKTVNVRARWLTPVSDETVARALHELHGETGDRRFERLRRA